MRSDMRQIKEEQMDAPPGFTTPLLPKMDAPPGFTTPLLPEITSCGGGTASTPSAAVADAQSGSDQVPSQLQHPIECMQQDQDPPPSSTNLVDRLKHNSNRKRKRNVFPAHRTDPFSKARQARIQLPLGTPMARGSNFQYDFNRTIASLNAKHGDIGKDCNLSSEWMKKLILFGIWRLLKEFNDKKLDQLNLSSLKPYYEIVEDTERMNINMKWLIKRLDEIKDAIISRDAAKVLEAEKSEHVQKRDEKRQALKRLTTQVKKKEDLVALDDLIIEELDGEISYRVSKFQRFQCRPLLDGLI